MVEKMQTNIPCVGAIIHSCLFTHRALVEMNDDENDLHLLFESPFDIINNDEVHVVDPSANKNHARVLELLGSKVVHAGINHYEVLTIQFDSGHVLVAKPSQNYESWHVDLLKQKKSYLASIVD